MNCNAMAHRKALSLALSAPLLLLAALTGCDSAGAPADAGEPPLEGAAIGAPFELTGETGDTVRWSDFDGQYRILYFGYAYCPDICPTDVQRAMAGLKRFEDADPERGAQVQPLFISVDPERDTPEVLREFTDSFHPRLIGMTGETEVLKQVASDFGTTFSKGEVQPGGGYLMDHLGYTYLFGPAGEPLAILPTDLGPEAVAEELDKWVR
jgi:protein SCO1